MDPSSISAIQSNSGQDLEVRKKQLRQQCREFESVMIGYLMKTMREGVMKAEEPEHAREIYEDMLSGQMSREMGKGGFLGIGDMLFTKLEPLLKTQKTVKQQTPDAQQAPAAERPPRNAVSRKTTLSPPAKSISIMK